MTHTCAPFYLYRAVYHTGASHPGTAVSGIVRLHITCSITTAVNRLSLLITVSQAIVLLRQDLALHNGAKASIFSLAFAEVAELVDAHDSGSCGGHLVEVRVLSSALSTFNEIQSLGITAIPHLVPPRQQARLLPSWEGCMQLRCSSFFEFE